MESCSESYRLLETDLHNSCNMSNIMYLIAGIYGLIVLPNWYRLTGVLIILISIFSFIHHSNKNYIGIAKTIWSKLDVIFANIGILVALVLVLYSRKTINIRTISVVMILGVISFILFTIALIAENKVKKGDPKDPIKTWGIGNILAEKNPQQNYEPQRFQVLFLSYHTSWHLVSALCVLSAIIALVPALKKKNH